MSDEYAFMVATYVDLAAADADYSAVHQLFSGFDPSMAFDAVTVGRKASIEIRFGQRPAGDRSPDGPSWSLAEGLAAALFPSVGADAPATQLAAREILSDVSGEVSRRLGRDAVERPRRAPRRLGGRARWSPPRPLTRTELARH